MYLVVVVLALAAGGCGSRPLQSVPTLTVVVPGSAGDGPWYDDLREGLSAHGPVSTFTWGAPQPLSVLNLQSDWLHRPAERALGREIADWRTRYPDGTINLVGHSAGCGVILGALGSLPGGVAVDRVTLLAPSVSPGYDLAPAAGHVRGRIHVFHSTRDRLFLKWRTGIFGTYDNVRTPAAGHGGFSLERCAPHARAKVVQHAYDPAWDSLDNDGTHDGCLARKFVDGVLRTLK